MRHGIRVGFWLWVQYNAPFSFRTKFCVSLCRSLFYLSLALPRCLALSLSRPLFPTPSLFLPLPLSLFPPPSPLTASDLDIHVWWLPYHVGIPGNEGADRAAKTARRSDTQPCLTLYPQILIITSTRTPLTYDPQKTWDGTPLNKLHEIAPIINESCTYHLNRRVQSFF